MVAFTAGDAGVAVQASSAIEGQFTPVRINGEQFIDADWVAPLPVRLARSLGAQRVLAVDATAHEDRAPSGAEVYRVSDQRKRAPGAGRRRERRRAAASGLRLLGEFLARVPRSGRSRPATATTMAQAARLREAARADGPHWAGTTCGAPGITGSGLGRQLGLVLFLQLAVALVVRHAENQALVALDERVGARHLVVPILVRQLEVVLGVHLEVVARALAAEHIELAAIDAPCVGAAAGAPRHCVVDAVGAKPPNCGMYLSG